MTLTVADEDRIARESHERTCWDCEEQTSDYITVEGHTYCRSCARGWLCVANCAHCNAQLLDDEVWETLDSRLLCWACWRAERRAS